MAIIIKDLPISVSEVDGMFLAKDDKLGLYGTGQTRQEAIDDYVSMFWDLFSELSKDEVMLAPWCRDQLNYMRSLITPDNGAIGGGG